MLGSASPKLHHRRRLPEVAGPNRHCNLFSMVARVRLAIPTPCVQSSSVGLQGQGTNSFDLGQNGVKWLADTSASGTASLPRSALPYVTDAGRLCGS